MGTSNSFGGPAGATPLVPSWLGEDDVADPPAGENPEDASPGGETDDNQAEGDAPSASPAPQLPPIPPLQSPMRFTAPRGNFTRFASSNGSDRAALGRAVSGYVGASSNGARTASARMGASGKASQRLVHFLSSAVSRGPVEALRELNLEELAGLPIERVFIGLADYICPESGSVDKGIAREAFIETIVQLATSGVESLDDLTTDQMQSVFELYATNAIVLRLCNDVGTKLVSMPSDARAAELVQQQLEDFIRRGVADALTDARVDAESLTPDRVVTYVDSVYERAFRFLQIFGEEEAA